MLSERSSRALAGIRFPLVLMVLAMHVHPEALHAGPVFSPAATALTQLGFMAVPCFFLMSGYLFFRGLEDWDWKACGRKLRSRVHTLLIPYLIFNLLCVAAPLAGVDNPARNPDALPVLGWFWDSVTYNAGAENWLGFSLQLFYLAASFATLSLAYALSVREPSPLDARLSESSFFVYALHMVTFGSFSLLGGIDSLLASLLSAGTSAFGAWCYMFIAPVAVAAACFLLFMLLRRLCPSVLAVLTGGRLNSRH